MDSTERRRLNRLLRKAAPPSLNKSLCYKQKFSKNVQKQLKPGLNCTEKSSKQEINSDVATLCAEMCGVSNLSPAATLLLQRHLNHITRLLIHNTLRVTEQSRRGVPQASDIDLASVLCGLENPFGTMTTSFLPIRTGGRTAGSGTGGKLVFIKPEKEIDVKALVLREPTGVIYDVSLVAHWLSINGIQPTSPQNPPPDFLKKISLLNNNFSYMNRSDPNSGLNKAGEIGHKLRSDDVESKCPTSKMDLSQAHPRKVLAVSVDRRTHEISQELMIYFRELTEACVGASENRRHEALENATLDPGLQPILPHLMTFIAEGVRINVTNHNLAILIYLMRLVKALIDNPHISLEPYLHLLVPTVITCVINRQLCAKPITDNHWALRDFAARQLVTLCNRHNTSTNELYTRITRELSRALCNWIEVANSTTNTIDPTAVKLSNLNLPSTGKMNNNGSDNTDFSSNSNRTSENTVGVSANSSSVTGSGMSTKGPSLGSAVHSLNTLYGILVSLYEFGAQCVRTMIFPLLPSLCHRLTILTEPQTNTSLVGSTQTSSLLLNTSLTDSTGQNPLAPYGLANKLSAADQRSFDFLKVLLNNKMAALLFDWRLRQGLGVGQEDYRSAYGCMATCLYVKNQNTINSASTTVTVTTTTTASATTTIATVSTNSITNTTTSTSIITTSSNTGVNTNAVNNSQLVSKSPAPTNSVTTPSVNQTTDIVVQPKISSDNEMVTDEITSPTSTTSTTTTSTTIAATVTTVTGQIDSGSPTYLIGGRIKTEI